ncbi:MAG: hypothetical protein AAGF35_04920 [Pseudomonadota bacterium]
MIQYPTVVGPDADDDVNLRALLDKLHAQHHHAICATLVYGSCLRTGDIYDGLLDLYLICTHYREAYHRRALAAANWLLPPNVFYAEVSEDERTLRAKVTVISFRDFQRGCSSAWFQSYIWGRFAQPTHILHASSAPIREQVEQSLLQAAHTLLHNALPLMHASGTVTHLWQHALGLSYSTELRTERSGRAAELAAESKSFYETVTRAQAASLGQGFTVYDGDGELRYQNTINKSQRFAATAAWFLRKVQGKLLSITRLVKALFTFEGGLDYIAWKLQRHSGEQIVIPEKVRRAPLIYMWGFFWGLYRRGVFK